MILLVCSLSLPLLAGCYALGVSDGGGQNVSFQPPRRVNPADIALPAGYSITALATNLDFPTGLCFDDRGDVYVTEEAGRLIRLNADGTRKIIASGDDTPWNGVAYSHGFFLVAANGRIIKIAPDGTQASLIDGLPSMGDFSSTGPAIGPDGAVYFGQGAATNSGIVGPDNPWVASAPQFHDIPPIDVKVTGFNVQTGSTITGPYSAFGTPTAPGQVIPGQIPCTGAIMKIPAGGTAGDVQLVAWGLRDPVGMAFGADGRLFVTDRSYDVRGSRPVSGSADLLWAIRDGLWYGWPDYCGDEPLTWTDKYAAPNQPAPQFLLADHSNVPPAPTGRLPVHGHVGTLDFSSSDFFGHSGEAFIAEFGDLAPLDGKVLSPVGFNVVRVNAATGVMHVFAANKGPGNGPASKLGTAGLERPIAVRFDPEGRYLYVVDYGVVTVDTAQRPVSGTGVVWKISREGD